jgi:hypothetical protein
VYFFGIHCAKEQTRDAKQVTLCKKGDTLMRVYVASDQVCLHEKAGRPVLLEDEFSAVRGLLRGLVAGIALWSGILYLTVM